MKRGARCWIVLAAVASLAANKPQANSELNSGDSDEIAAALDNVAAALKTDNEVLAYQQPCNENGSNRNSDLCAQWQAADAARSAADAAWDFGYVGAILGLLTLVAAAVAAFYARKAAIHTEESAIEGKRAADTAESALENSTEASQTDLRAWVSIDLALDRCGRTEKSAGITATIKLKNIGKSPALGVAVSLNAYVRPSIVVGEVDLAEVEKFPSNLLPLMPQQEFEQSRAIFIHQKDIEEGIVAAKKSGSLPMIVVDSVVYYRTIFDNEKAPKHMTSVQYLMLPTIPQELRKERAEWLDQRGPVMEETSFTRNMSAQLHLT